MYCRVSSKKQCEGNGLAAQLQSAMTAASSVFGLEGYVIAEVFKEAVRGGRGASCGGSPALGYGVHQAREAPGVREGVRPLRGLGRQPDEAQGRPALEPRGRSLP